MGLLAPYLLRGRAANPTNSPGKIPAEFINTIEVTSIDKKGIKQALKDGPVSWAHLEQGESITIK